MPLSSLDPPDGRMGTPREFVEEMVLNAAVQCRGEQ